MCLYVRNVSIPKDGSFTQLGDGTRLLLRVIPEPASLVRRCWVLVARWPCGVGGVERVPPCLHSKGGGRKHTLNAKIRKWVL